MKITINTTVEKIETLINDLVVEAIDTSDNYLEAKKTIKEQAYRFVEAPNESKEFVINLALKKINKISLNQKIKKIDCL